MLNESFMLLKALEKANIDLPVRHPRIKDVVLSGGPCLRICLDAGGKVSDLEEISTEEYSNLWIIIKTSDGSFPVVRINKPIYEIDDNFLDQIKLRKNREKSNQLINVNKSFSLIKTSKNNWPWKDARLKANEIKDNNNNTTIDAFINRFLEATEDPHDLLKEIDEKAVNKFQINRLSEKRLRLYESGEKEKSQMR